MIEDDRHRPYYLPEDDLHHLDIVDTTLEDTGNYTAVAKNKFGTAKCTAELVIEGIPPKFTVLPEAKLVPITQPVSFTCQVTGVPTPEVSYEYNSKPLEPVEKYQISYNPEEDVHYLTIPETTLEDSGDYKIIAKNKFGTARVTAELLVEGVAPEFVVLPEAMLVPFNEDIPLKCKVKGIPQPEVKNFSLLLYNNAFGNLSFSVHTIHEI